MKNTIKKTNRGSHSPGVAILDDDASFRKSVCRLVLAHGCKASVFESAAEFLRSGDLDATECLILDLDMPGMDGLELQQHLSGSGCHVPIVFVTRHAANDLEKPALKAGAVKLLHKPVTEYALITAIETALAR